MLHVYDKQAVRNLPRSEFSQSMQSSESTRGTDNTPASQHIISVRVGCRERSKDNFIFAEIQHRKRIKHLWSTPILLLVLGK